MTGIEGFSANKTFYRRYDTKNEYVVRSSEFPGCERSYLGEDMPEPSIPPAATFSGLEIIDDKQCEHWLYKHGESRLHIYVREVDSRRLPWRLVDEYVDDNTKTSEPIMTYTFHNVSTAQLDEGLFALPAPYTHETCERKIGGEPYLHLFSYFFMV